MNPKTKAILKQVEILAQTYPDFVYAADHNHGILCKYNNGSDPKYPELCGCIIGQAARKAGINTSDWDASPDEINYRNTGIRTHIGNKLGEDRYSSEAYFLQRIQNLQDMGTPWGKAYGRPMETIKLD